MKITDWCVVLQTGIFFLAFGVAAWQVCLLRIQISVATDQLVTQHKWERRKATFDYLGTYITQLNDINRDLHQRLNLLTHNGKEMTREAIGAELGDEKARTELFHLVSYFENLAIGISCNYFEDHIAYDLLSNVVVSTYESLKPYLQIRKEETKVDVGCEFRKLAKRWQGMVDRGS